jgi:hypothetical protein
LNCNLQLTYLKSLYLENLPSYSNLSFSNNLDELLSIDNVGQSGTVTTINFANLTLLKTLIVQNMPQINGSSLNSLYNNNNLFSSLRQISLSNVNCTNINLASFDKLKYITLRNLPTITGFNLPYNSVESLFIYNLPGVTPQEVDSVIIGLNSNGITNGYLSRSRNNSTDLLRTNASDTALSSLISKGWILPGYSGGGYYGDGYGELSLDTL